MEYKANRKHDLFAAEKWLSLIGKPQRTTAKGYGKLHGLTIKPVIHHQETDGAKNYHDAPHPFNVALGQVIKQEWDRLTKEALAIMKRKAQEENAANLDWLNDRMVEAQADMEELTKETT